MTLFKRTNWKSAYSVTGYAKIILHGDEQLMLVSPTKCALERAANNFGGKKIVRRTIRKITTKEYDQA